MEDTSDFTIALNVEGIRQLRSSVEYLIKVWPGSPARPAEEQEFLWSLRDTCTRCELEYAFSIDQ